MNIERKSFEFNAGSISHPFSPSLYIPAFDPDAEQEIWAARATAPGVPTIECLPGECSCPAETKAAPTDQPLCFSNMMETSGTFAAKFALGAAAEYKVALFLGSEFDSSDLTKGLVATLPVVVSASAVSAVSCSSICKAGIKCT